MVTQATKDKINSTLKGRVTSETKAKISGTMRERDVSLAIRELMIKSHSKSVLVTNIETKEQTIYPFIKKTTIQFNTT